MTAVGPLLRFLRLAPLTAVLLFSAAQAGTRGMDLCDLGERETRPRVGDSGAGQPASSVSGGRWASVNMRITDEPLAGDTISAPREKAEELGTGLDEVSQAENRIAPAYHISTQGFQSVPVSSPVYYVSPYGDDSRSKSQAANLSTPWRTLQRAADNVVAGDNVVVMDGIYTRDTTGFLADLKNSGTVSAPIRFIAENRWGAVLDGNYQNHSIFNLRAGVSHIIIEGFEMRQARHSSVWNNAQTGEYNTGVVVRGNWIHHNSRNREVPCTGGGNAPGSGIVAITYSRYWVIENNLIHSNTRFPAPSSCVYENKFDHGLYIQGHGHIIQNNILFDHVAGYDLKADHRTESGFTYPANERAGTYINNTFATGNNPSKLGTVILHRNSGGSGDKPRNVLFMNNIIWEPSGSHAISVGSGGWVWPGLEIINNITTADHLIWNRYNTDAIKELLDVGGTYQSNTTNQTHPGIKGSTLGMVNPKTMGAMDRDFHLTESATLLMNRGVSNYSRSGLAPVYAPNRDYRGRNRSLNIGIDLGAYEWSE